jgi:hypothetical protein
MRRARKDLEEGVREKYEVAEAVEVPIKPYAPPNLIVSNRHISSPTKIYDRGRGFVGLHAGEIVKKEIKMSGDPSKEKIASGKSAQRGLQRSVERQEGRAPDSQRQLGFLRAPPRSGVIMGDSVRDLPTRSYLEDALQDPGLANVQS